MSSARTRLIGTGNEKHSMNFRFRRLFSEVHSRCRTVTLSFRDGYDGPRGRIFVGKSDKPEYLALKMANRHGLVTGATGTGKTVTLQVLAEGFSRAGVPVFAADIKGDLSGIAACGEPRDFLVARAKQIGVRV